MRARISLESMTLLFHRLTSLLLGCCRGVLREKKDDADISSFTDACRELNSSRTRRLHKENSSRSDRFPISARAKHAKPRGISAPIRNPGFEISRDGRYREIAAIPFR